MKLPFIGPLAKGLLIAMSLAASFVFAAPVTCPESPVSYVSLVSGTTACQYDTSVGQDFNHDPLTVNTQGFFGFEDWSVINHGVSANGTSGSWSFDADFWSSYTEIMLIFKSGSLQSGSFLVGYLVEANTSSGTWASPFRSPLFNFKNPKDLSHISYYGRGLPQVTVSESNPLLLMLIGLMGLGFIRRRIK